MNPYALFGEFMGLVLIVLVFGGGHIKRLLDILDRRLTQTPPRARLSDEEMKHLEQLQKGSGGASSGQFEALREEVARLRDTSTQYDISIQHTLEDLQRRVEHLETRRQYNPVAVGEEEPQTLEARRGS